MNNDEVIADLDIIRAKLIELLSDLDDGLYNLLRLPLNTALNATLDAKKRVMRPSEIGVKKHQAYTALADLMCHNGKSIFERMRHEGEQPVVIVVVAGEDAEKLKNLAKNYLDLGHEIA